MKLFRKKNVDERVAAEANKVYKIGYLILSIGILLDIVAKEMMGFELFEGNVRALVIAVVPELVIFLAAQFICLGLMIHRGLSDDDSYAEVEKFPLGHYCLISLVASMAVFIICGCMLLYSKGLANWLAILIICATMAVLCFISIILLQYVAFRMARKRRHKKMEDE